MCWNGSIVDSFVGDGMDCEGGEFRVGEGVRGRHFGVCVCMRAVDLPVPDKPVLVSGRY